MIALLTSLVLCSLALASGAQVDVLRVGPGAEHRTLQSAIDAAQDGDIILVDSASVSAGAPETALVDGLGLTIIGDGPQRPVLPVLGVQNVPAGSEVVLRHLDFVPERVDPFTGGLVTIRDCVGAVLVEDCRIVGFDSQVENGGVGGPGLFIGHCAGVSVVRSTIRGGHGNPTVDDPPVLVTFAGHGGRALRIINAAVTLHDCSISGGDGGSAPRLFTNGGGGGLGLDTQNARLWVVGCAVSGGDGGVGSPPGTSGFGAQIDGFDAPTTDFRQLDSTFVGGTGMPGLVVVNGSQQQLPGEAMTLELSAPVRPTETASLELDGPPGTLFAVFLSLEAGFVPSDPFHGAWLTGFGSFAGPLVLTTVPASGTFSSGFLVPAAGLLDGFSVVLQALGQQPDGTRVLSGASTWVQIEDGG